MKLWSSLVSGGPGGLRCTDHLVTPFVHQFYTTLCVSAPFLKVVHRLILNKRDDLRSLFRNLTIVCIRILKNQFSLRWDSSPCPLPYRCDAFPTELWCNLCRGFSLGKKSFVNINGSKNVKCKLEFSTVRKDSSFF